MSLRLQRKPDNVLAERKQSGEHRLLIIGVAVLFVFATMQVMQAQKKGPPTELRVTDADIQSLNGKLLGFERQLSGQEKGGMDLVLWRAATAPLDDPSGTNIRGSFFDLGSPTEAVRPAERKKIGGAGPQPPAADAEFVKILYAALGVGDTSIDQVTANKATHGETRNELAVPKRLPQGVINVLADKLQAFGRQLSVPERVIMNWLFQRAGTSEAREAAGNTGPLPGTPGGQPPTLGQALGFAAFGLRPAGNSSNGWVLRD